KGLSADEASTVRIFLMRQGGQESYLVRLAAPSKAPAFPFDYQAAYSIPQMQLPAPAAGNYTLQGTIDTSARSATDGSALAPLRRSAFQIRQVHAVDQLFEDRQPVFLFLFFLGKDARL